MLFHDQSGARERLDVEGEAWCRKPAVVVSCGHGGCQAVPRDQWASGVSRGGESSGCKHLTNTTAMAHAWRCRLEPLPLLARRGRVRHPVRLLVLAPWGAHPHGMQSEGEQGPAFPPVSSKSGTTVRTVHYEPQRRLQLGERTSRSDLGQRRLELAE